MQRTAGSWFIVLASSNHAAWPPQSKYRTVNPSDRPLEWLLLPSLQDKGGIAITMQERVFRTPGCGGERLMGSAGW